MKIAIVCSTADVAGMNIRKALLEQGGFSASGDMFDGHEVLEKTSQLRLYTTDRNTVFLEDIDKTVDAELFIFATKHEAKAGIPSLSVHTQGNWAQAGYGGRDRNLGISPACYLKEGMKRLDEWGGALKRQGFEVIQECTHHGPYMERPSMFIEVGSDLKMWQNMEAASLVARVILHLAAEEPPKCRTAVGIGGLHHAPNFRKIMLSTDIAVGHICPKYMLGQLDREMVEQALERTVPRAEMVILDWKGLDSKERVSGILEGLPAEVKKTKEF